MDSANLTLKVTICSSPFSKGFSFPAFEKYCIYIQKLKASCFLVENLNRKTKTTQMAADMQTSKVEPYHIALVPSSSRRCR